MNAERRTFQIPVTLDNAMRRKDRSVSFRFSSSQEIPTSEFASIDSFYGNEGWLLFSANSFSDADVPTTDAPNDGKKPSVRLRGALFIDWKENTDGSEDFEAFYRRNVERFISEVKSRLP